MPVNRLDMRKYEIYASLPVTVSLEPCDDSRSDRLMHGDSDGIVDS